MKHRSIVTKYTEISAISGEPAEQWHHLIWGDGGAKRDKADEDGLLLPLTADEHTTGPVTGRIHDNPMAEKLSKICGQLAWEKNWYQNHKGEAKGLDDDPAREAFRKRYGKSYL